MKRFFSCTQLLKGSLSFFVIIYLCSCSNSRKFVYFQDLPRDTTLTDLVSKNFESKIQKNDLLDIKVASISPENTAIYNAPQNADGALSGYLVDESGNIQFIKLGTLHVEGLTRKELKFQLQKDLAAYLKDPVVVVSFLNRHVTMMGAISPKVLPMTTDNMTLFDALATSGDLGNQGRADNILVIREKGTSKEFKRLNLTDRSIFYSPYFYLHPNDVVYVEPVKIKRDITSRIISYISTGLSLVFLVLTRIIK